MLEKTFMHGKVYAIISLSLDVVLDLNTWSGRPEAADFVSVSVIIDKSRLFSPVSTCYKVL